MLKICRYVPIVAVLLVVLSGCTQPVGRAFVQGEWFEKACADGGGHYDASGRGSCPDFSLKEIF